jgi:hypothetical protein
MQNLSKKLKEMILIVRPTNGNGIIPIQELEFVLSGLGFDYLSMKSEEIGRFLDSSRTVCF